MENLTLFCRIVPCTPVAQCWPWLFLFYMYVGWESCIFCIREKGRMYSEGSCSDFSSFSALRVLSNFPSVVVCCVVSPGGARYLLLFKREAFWTPFCSFSFPNGILPMQKPFRRPFIKNCKLTVFKWCTLLHMVLITISYWKLITFSPTDFAIKNELNMHTGLLFVQFM